MASLGILDIMIYEYLKTNCDTDIAEDFSKQRIKAIAAEKVKPNAAKESSSDSSSEEEPKKPAVNKNASSQKPVVNGKAAANKVVSAKKKADSSSDSDSSSEDEKKSEAKPTPVVKANSQPVNKSKKDESSSDSDSDSEESVTKKATAAPVAKTPKKATLKQKQVQVRNSSKRCGELLNDLLDLSQEHQMDQMVAIYKTLALICEKELSRFEIIDINQHTVNIVLYEAMHAATRYRLTVESYIYGFEGHKLSNGKPAILLREENLRKAVLIEINVMREDNGAYPNTSLNALHQVMGLVQCEGPRKNYMDILKNENYATIFIGLSIDCRDNGKRLSLSCSLNGTDIYYISDHEHMTYGVKYGPYTRLIVN